MIIIENRIVNDIEYNTLGNTGIGTVEMGILDNENASKCIALITDIHPREVLAIWK